LERVLKKPLTAALLTAVAVSLLAVPAEASTPTSWAHGALPCPTGHKSATWVQKWRGDAMVNSWYTNSCRQPLNFVHCQVDSQSDCQTYTLAPGHKGQLGPTEGVVVRFG
jgi:hypothetical protein